MVDFYISTLFRSRFAGGGYYGYVMTVDIGGKVYGKESGPLWTDGTQNEAELQALLEALDKMTKPSQITVHTDSQYLYGNYSNLEQWKVNNFMTAKGQQVRHDDLWRGISTKAEYHQISLELNEKYTEVGKRIEAELKAKREKDEKDV